MSEEVVIAVLAMEDDLHHVGKRDRHEEVDRGFVDVGGEAVEPTEVVESAARSRGEEIATGRRDVIDGGTKVHEGRVVQDSAGGAAPTVDAEQRQTETEIGEDQATRPNLIEPDRGDTIQSAGGDGPVEGG
ncbi:hypothetical protein FHR81_001328 [Actinoalloteichus hoggarensis]|nr:hypothetical protein [Actinoalloteichus hoggarensis]MBB5920298.1 hypothetical protein [Actinoalloteichus hoggarensis]